MSVASFSDGTPLSGWHYVCPCGWTTYSHNEPPTQAVRAHHEAHTERIRNLWTQRQEKNDD